MASEEQFSLCWNNFHTNMSSGFHNLLSRGDLVDVTLAAEGRLLQAHKLVLSVSSPYFQDMFRLNPSQHPIVFLKDVSHSALRDLLQFMYQGEVNVKQDELASFISTGEQLQVKGLTGNQNENSSTPASKPKPSLRPGLRLPQRQSLKETDLDSRSSNPVAAKRPNRSSVTPCNPQSSQPAPAKRKCVDPLGAGPSGMTKEEFVMIPDDDGAAVALKMEPEFVDESLWEEDDDGPNNDDGNFEDDSNMEMSGLDVSATGDTSVAGATGEGGAGGDAQEVPLENIYFERNQRDGVVLISEDGYSYLRRRKGKNTEYWCCDQKKSCPGSGVSMDNRKGFRKRKAHNHEPDALKLEIRQLKNHLREAALNAGSTESAKKVIQIALDSAPASDAVKAMLPNIDHLVRSLQRHRKQKPKLDEQFTFPCVATYDQSFD